MSEGMRSSLEKVRPLLLGFSTISLLIVMVTGMLLSMWYVPSSEPLRTADGRPQTIVTSTRFERVGPNVDTVLASQERPQLAPATGDEAVLSTAQRSIRISIHNAPCGMAIRTIHYWMSDVLLASLAAFLVVLCFVRAYATEPAQWLRVLLLLIIAVAGGWTGRILVDDVYAEISRRIMGHELQTTPLGGFFSAFLGIQPGALILARTYSVHGFVLGILGILLVSPDVRRMLRGSLQPTVLVSALLVTIGAAVLSIPDWGMRDAVRGLAGWEHVTPWWGIVSFRTWSQWLGSELAGYLVIPAVLALAALPYWYQRTSGRTVTILLAGIAMAIVVGFLFGY